MSATIPDGGAAFPVSDTIHPNGQVQYGHNGMTLRDWFAGKALVGELASTSGVESTQAMAEAAVNRGVAPAIHLALTCYEIADAMIKARTA
jgi:hypothetical protein